MKYASVILLSLFLSVSCSKREIDTEPLKETTKTGGDAGTGSTGSLGSSNPGSETGAAEAPSENSP